MRTIVIASMRKSAGKTSIIAGLMKSLGKKSGYMKPFGDRLLYKKKRLWDFDAAAVIGLFKLQENAEDITIGFEHSKLKYMYDAAGIKAKLQEISKRASAGKDLLLVEGGGELSYGVSVNLSSVQVASALNAELVVVLSGDDRTIADDLVFLRKGVDLAKVKLKGVIVNKLHDIEDFKAANGDVLNDSGVPILGFVPYEKELSSMHMGLISEYLMAKVVTGEGGLNNIVRNIFVGAMSADMAANHPLFKKDNKLIITSGDRSDLILTSLDSGAVGVVLTNNMLPSTNIIAKATDRNIPLLLVAGDTYTVAKQIDAMEPLLTKDDPEKAELLGKMVKGSVKL